MRARAARYGVWKLQPRVLYLNAADLAQCRYRRASAIGVGWSAPRVGREDNHAKSARAHLLNGRTDGSPRGGARVGRVARGLETAVVLLQA